MKKINCPNVAKNLFILLIVSLVFAIYFQSNAYALTSDNINFQGKIVRNDTGFEGLNVVPGSPACVVDGAGNDTCDFQVAYYTASTAGTLLLTETFTNVEIGQYDGVFELSLGSGSMTTTGQCRDGTCNTPVEVISEYKDVYLELKFSPDGTNLTETFTRMPLEASPYAILSKYAEGANDAFKLSTSVSSQSQASPVTGMVYYNTTTSQLTVYNGTSWEGIKSSLWTDAGTFTYLTSTTDDLVLGASTVSDSTFFFDMDGSSGSYLEIDSADNTSRLFTILSGGNVGIGTATPGAKLEVAGSSSTITNASGDLTISTGGLDGNIIFSPNGTGSVRANSPFGVRETGTTPTYYTYFEGGDQVADITYTLPIADGTASGQVLSTNASGVLSWQTVATGSTAWDDILDPDSNSAIVHGAYSTDMQFDTFTSGSAFKVSSAATGLTGSLFDVSLTGSNAANTGSLFALNNTGTLNTNTSFLINHYATGTGNLAFRVNDESGDTTPFVIDGTGNVGIGISNPDVPLEIVAPTLASYDPVFEVRNWMRFRQDSASGPKPVLEVYSSGVWYPSFLFSTGQTDSFHNIRVKDEGEGIIFGSNTAGYIHKISTNSETISLKADRVNSGATWPRTIYSINTSDLSPTSRLFTINVPLKIQEVSGQSGDLFNIVNTSSSSLFYVNNVGNVGIGLTSPTAYLNLKAGTASAGTAPLKFTTGVNLTTPESGAMEWDGSRLYMTDITLTRNTIAYTSDLASFITGVRWDEIANPTTSKTFTMAGNVTDFTFNSVTTANAYSLSTTSLTTGNLFNLSSTSTALTTGGLLNIAATGSPSSSWTGSLGKMEYTSADADIDGSALKLGLLGTSAAGSGTVLNITTSQIGSGALALRVNDDGTYTDTTSFVVDKDGNVGVGLISPTEKLQVLGGIKYEGEVHDTSLVGHYSFNSADVSVTTVYNEEGTGNNGTRVGEAIYSVDSISGNSMSFDGTLDLVDIPGGMLSGKSAVTLSAWFRTTDTAGGIISHYLNSSTYVYNLFVNSGKLNVCFAIAAGTCGTTTAQVTSTANVNDGKWHNALATWDGTTVKLYLDSIYIGQYALSGTVPAGWSDRLHSIGFVGFDSVGVYYAQGAGGLQGVIDDVKLYSRVLDADEIIREYSKGTARVGSSSFGEAFLAGNLGIGVISPTGVLHLKAGTATVGTAPLKFTTGVNLTTAESGAMEWDGSRLYITNTTPTRNTIAYNPMTTAGDIVYGGTSGVETRLPGSTTNGYALKYNTSTNQPYWSEDIDNYVDSVSFNTGDGVLTLGRTGSLADLTYDLDGRYLESVNWSQISNGSGVYMDYKPNNTACGSNQVLKYDTGNSRWICADDYGGTGGDDWGSQLVVSDSTLTGNGTSASPLGIALTNANTWTGTQTFRGIVLDTATSTDDRILLNVTAGGSNRFDGTITNADLTAARTWTLPNATGTLGVVVRTDSTTNPAAVGYTGTTQTSGYLYGGSTTAPSNNTYYLNYSGRFRATELYEGTSRVLTSVNWSQIANGSGVYMDYKPNNTACTGGQVLKYTVGTGWLCGDDNAGVGGDDWGSQTVVSDTLPLTGVGTSASPLDFNYSNTLAANPAMLAGEVIFGTTGIIFEGATADVYEGLLTVTDPTADTTWTLPGTSGTIALSSQLYWSKSSGIVYPTTSGDKVSIGNSSPTSPRALSVQALDANNVAIEGLEMSGVHSIYIRPNSSGYNLISSNYSSGSVYLPLSLSAREVASDFIISTSGNVGIGTTSPDALLDVEKDSATYSSTSFNSPTMYLTASDTNYDYTGIGFRNTSGNRESFFGVVQGNASDLSNFVFQGYDGTSHTYKEFMRINDIGNVGIGTTTPSNKFVVNTSGYSTIELQYGGTSVVDIFSNASSNIFIGLDSGSVISTGTGNIALGDNALSANTTGLSNTAIGHYALDSNVAKQGSTALGYQAMMYANSTATAGLSYNTAIGYQALTGSGLAANNTGTQNTAVGHQSMTANTSGSSNTALGVNTLNANTTGTENVAIGQNALFTNVAKQGSVAIGYEAMRYANNTATANQSFNTAVGYQALMGSSIPANNLGDRNTVFGYQSGMNMTSGGSNTLIGVQAGYSNTTGYGNVAIGADSLSANATGTRNVVIGQAALGTNATGDHSDSVAIGYYSMGEAGGGTAGNVGLGRSTLLGVSGNYNTALGYGAGQDLTNGSYNILIGYNVQASTITSSNELNIGNTIYGNLSNDYISIGDSTPTEGMFTVGATSQFRIDTNGDLTRIKDVPYTWPSSNASGILANNGSGTLSWSTIASLGGVTGTGAGTATAGQITWWNGTSTITGENDFYWDASNNRLGIGTSTPTASIDIAGASSTISNASGNITITPASSTLAVAGSVNPTVTGSYDLGSSSLKWRSLYTSANIYIGNGTTYYAGNSTGDARFRYLGVGGANPTSSYPLNVTGTAQIAGDILFTSGAARTISVADAGGVGNNLTLRAGMGASTNAGGHLYLNGGSSESSGTSGSVYINSGASAGTIGDIILGNTYGNVGIGTSTANSKLRIFDSSDSKPGGVVAATKTVLKLSRVGTGGYSWEEDAEFRIGHGGPSVYGSKLDLYINGAANTSGVPDQHVMTWNYDGFVGIGTDSPSYKLHVHQPSVTSNFIQVTTQNTGTATTDGLLIGYNEADGAKLLNRENTKLILGTNNDPVMTFHNHGTVNIGAATTTGIEGDVAIARTSNTATAAIYFGINGSNYIYFSGTRFEKTGTAGWQENSDQRIKTEVQELNYGLNEILALSPKSYNLHQSTFDNGVLNVSSESNYDMGLIAQEAFNIIPEIVNKPENEMTELWTLNYTPLIPILIKAIQEQQEIINILDTKISILGQNNALTPIVTPTFEISVPGWYRIASLSSNTNDYGRFKINNTSVGSSQNLLISVDSIDTKENINVISNFTSGDYNITKTRINIENGTKYLEIYLPNVNGNQIKVSIDGGKGEWVSTSITQVIQETLTINEYSLSGVLFGVSDMLQVEDTGLKVGGDLVASSTNSNIGDTTSRWNDIYAKGAIRLGSGSGQEGAIRFNTESKRLELSNDGSTWVQLGDLTSQMVISAEYPGAILFADGSDNLGKMTSDAIEENATFKNYYEWISNKEVAQDYDILVRITLPNDFVSWKDDAIYLDYMTQNSVSVENNSVDVTLIGNSGVDAQSVDHISTLPGAWERMSLKSLDINDCNAPGDSCTLRISLTSSMEYFVRVGDITLNYNRSL